ncbi:cyanophycinase [Ideonella oryzae]|uniref:Cyanophycinase n=1 Tax=Ideonella oryzae TaxID=2937441 RepID=A0ABT1BLH4_9BURK|nr:hypothetical protein [Ideonella oryzae]MCO5976963.1 hypothetical protein [Ideonella oryzae]
MPGLPSLSCRSWRRLLCATLGWLSLGLAQAEGDSLVLHRLGAAENAVAALRGPALYLKGDGPPDSASFAAFLRQVSGDRLDVVVLGASYPDWEGECRTITGLDQVNSCTTIVIRQPQDAADPAVLDAIRRAEVVYFRGGDQCNFMHWRDSPLPAAVRQVVQRGGGTGGGSAGLAIQGSLAVYDGCQGSVTSPSALAEPYRDNVSFSEHLFDWSALRNTLTDSHFVKRDRMGRMMAFLCRQLAVGHTAQAWGLGINEGAAVVIDRNGLGTVHGDTAYMVLADRPSESCHQGADPVSYAGYKVWRLDAGQQFDFNQRPRTGYYRVDVVQGALTTDPYEPPAAAHTLALREPDRLDGL